MTCRSFFALTAVICLCGPLLHAGDRQQTTTAWRDVAYVATGTPDQRLDLTVPQRTGFPTVLFVHGGSLQESGERRTSPVYARVCEPFVNAGIGCATADYRLAPSHKWPAMPLDVASAIKWLKMNIASRGGDPARVFLFGHSSGCHLVAVLGANPKYLKEVGLAPSDIAGIIPMGCVLAPLEEPLHRMTLEDFRQRWPGRSGESETFTTVGDRLDSDPSRFIGPHMPPTLVVCAEAERFFPSILEQGAKFVRRLLEQKRPADLVIVPGRHMSSIQNIIEPGDPTFVAVKSFIDNPGRMPQ
jgi:acetyl esterase/lipase